MEALGPEFAGPLTARLQQVDRVFRAELYSDIAAVNRLAAHVERFRGKMLRPTLLLLSAEALEPLRRGAAPDTVPHRQAVAAAVVEMVHMATLVHDDILDEAAVRRGGRTLNALEGNEAAVMLGDYLISHAYHLCSGLGITRLSRMIASTTNTVCEGELLQLDTRGDLSLSPRVYYEIIARKTAALTATCCRVPAVLLDPESRDPKVDAAGRALARYGRKVGIAFQIADDVLDLVADEDAAGKTTGRDLVKSKLTLPMLLWLQTLDAPERRATEDRIRGLQASAHEDPGRTEALVLELRNRVRDAGVVERTRDAARALTEGAGRILLAELPDSPARAALVSLAGRVVDRPR